MALEKWSLTDHICSNCFGRILERRNSVHGRCSENLAQPMLAGFDLPDINPEVRIKYQAHEPARIFRCADCGLRTVSDDHKDICCCGLKLKDGTDLGVRCTYSRTIENAICQTEIVAKQINNQEK
jgi:hypothetical protein